MQPLLQQQPQEPMQPDQPAQPDQEESGEGNIPEGQESGEFTINSDQIEEAIKKQLDSNQSKALNRILEAGNQLIFSKDTHNQIMEGLNDNDDTQLADELGKGGISLASILFEKSGGTMPQELIIPAGVILLARVAEFLNKTGHKINDEIFSQAVEMFRDGLNQKADPTYHDKIKQAMGEQSQDSQTVPQEQPMMQQGQQPGLLGAS